MSDAMQSAETELRERLKGLIIDSLKADYISTSGHMGYRTGNLYQSVRLGEEVQLGFRRADRRALFNNFHFYDKTVVDYGCNIGELSRLARQCGAKYVDGIEYDRYFVNVARLINSYNGCTRVSVKQGDLTDPETFSERYDIALAFSVFPYILPTLNHLSACVREILVLETHNTTTDIGKVYVEPVRRFFPFYTFVGLTDFSKGEGDRAVLVFAKEQGYLEKGGFVSPQIDLRQSRLDFADAFLSVANTVSPAGRRGISDLRKVSQTLSSGHDDQGRIVEGVAYWIDFIKGYLEFVDSQIIEENNSYVRSLRALIATYDFDPVLRTRLATTDELHARVKLRFGDVTRLANGAERALADINPVVAFNPSVAKGRYTLKTNLHEEPLRVSLMDGYHRTMWALFFGYEAAPIHFHYNSSVPMRRG